jgi:hypothetical protein
VIALWKRLTLFPALAATAFVASIGDWPLALGSGLALGIFQFPKSARAVNFLDLVDRSTFAFGLAAGLPLGFSAAKQVQGGQTDLNSLFHAVAAPAGVVIFIVLASFWIRAQLIRQTLRKGFLS